MVKRIIESRDKGDVIDYKEIDESFSPNVVNEAIVVVFFIRQFYILKENRVYDNTMKLGSRIEWSWVPFTINSVRQYDVFSELEGHPSPSKAIAKIRELAKRFDTERFDLEYLESAAEFIEWIQKSNVFEEDYLAFLKAYK